MENKFTWKNEYSVVLILNIIYIIIFYFIMTGNR
ncbi:hypothetical protein Celal_3365 [Cellulophaga algicola DSM 14237]|uniref:Uncharacterized protein n=1 Tax=Cellulophaga algicola (strain DSM 14237 / IC166 / ACAM 630) TaxID=688270 RepID=E6X671_CELAD|nr:hypothetical protein Celal_3365 [Cellulophaga algicola DSM 14237]